MADDSTRLLPLGDVIPVRPIHLVISAGDILILLGVAALIAAAMRDQRPDSLERENDVSRAAATPFCPDATSSSRRVVRTFVMPRTGLFLIHAELDGLICSGATSGNRVRTLATSAVALAVHGFRVRVGPLLLGPDPVNDRHRHEIEVAGKARVEP